MKNKRSWKKKFFQLRKTQEQLENCTIEIDGKHVRIKKTQKKKKKKS